MRLERMSWVHVEDYFKENDLVVISTGSIESHGKHIALGTDTVIPIRLLEMIEEKHPKYMIAPIIPYGATDDLTAYPGTINLGTELMYNVIKKVTESLYEHGARRFLVLNGHGGNVHPWDRLSLEWHRKGVWVANINWWVLAGELNEAWAGGHGDFEETAAVMGVDPSLVYKEYLDGMNLANDVSESLPTEGFDHVKFKNGKVRFFRDTRAYATNGWVGKKDPADATEEIGKEMLQTVADYVGDFMEEFAKIDLPPVLEK